MSENILHINNIPIAYTSGEHEGQGESSTIANEYLKHIHMLPNVLPHPHIPIYTLPPNNRNVNSFDEDRKEIHRGLARYLGNVIHTYGHPDPHIYSDMFADDPNKDWGLSNKGEIIGSHNNIKDSIINGTLPISNFHGHNDIVADNPVPEYLARILDQHIMLHNRVRHPNHPAEFLNNFIRHPYSAWARRFSHSNPVHHVYETYESPRREMYEGLPSWLIGHYLEGSRNIWER